MKYVLIVALAVGSHAMAWDLSYTATIDSQSPRYALPSEDLTSVPGGSQGNVRYSVTNFIAPFSGRFVFQSVALTNWDNYLVLYRVAFDPARPLTNAVRANDNNPTVGLAGFSATLTGGEQYYVVTSAAFNGSGFRQAANTVASAVPEPATWMLCAAGLAWGWRRRKTVRERVMT